MPVWGIPNNIDFYVKPIYVQQETRLDEEQQVQDDDIDLSTEANVNTSSLNELTMYVDYKTEDIGSNIDDFNSVYTVSTDDAKFYYDGKNIPSPYEIKIPIIKLQPNQTINLSAITTLGIEEQDAIFSAVSVCFYKEINLNEYEFRLSSRGQLSEIRIIEVAIKNIINDIEKIVEKISENKHEDLIGQIELHNQDNTMGNLLSHAMQLHPDVKFASYNIPHLLGTTVIIHYKLAKSDIAIVMNDVMDYLKKLFNKILEFTNKI
jgi:DNA-directed RNA polymerase subunit L